MTSELRRSGRDRLGRALSGLGILLLAYGVGCATSWEPVADADLTVLEGFASARSSAVTSAMRALTIAFDPHVSTVWAFMLGLVAWAGTRSWRIAALIPGSMIVTAGMTTLFKEHFDRVRPPFPTRLVIEPSWSYPSGHTAATASFAVAAAFVLIVALRAAGATGRDADDDEVSPLDSHRYVGRRIIAWTAGLALVALVGCSRLYLGAHWLSDVVGGALTGTGAALVCAALVLPTHLGLEHLDE